jgi:hypothetical protein
MHIQDSRPDPEHIFDLIIVGGGITGEGTARDAALGRLSYLAPRGARICICCVIKINISVLRWPSIACNLATFEVDLVAESLAE